MRICVASIWDQHIGCLECIGQHLCRTGTLVMDLWYPNLRELSAQALPLVGQAGSFGYLMSEFVEAILLDVGTGVARRRPLTGPEYRPARRQHRHGNACFARLTLDLRPCLPDRRRVPHTWWSVSREPFPVVVRYGSSWTP